MKNNNKRVYISIEKELEYGQHTGARYYQFYIPSKQMFYHNLTNMLEKVCNLYIEDSSISFQAVKKSPRRGVNEVFYPSDLDQDFVVLLGDEAEFYNNPSIEELEKLHGISCGVEKHEEY